MAAHKDKAAELRHAIDTARIGHLRKLKQEELDAHIERMRDVANHWCTPRRVEVCRTWTVSTRFVCVGHCAPCV